MMDEAIRNFPKQFEFEPVIVNGEGYKPKKKFVLCGMGGSALAPEVIKAWKPEVDIITRKDYGLPVMSEQEMKERIFIMSSYSGNTEETLSAFDEGLEKGVSMVAICVGAKLLEKAKKHNIPYVVMPNTGIQPRCALGFSVMGILKLMGMENEMQELKKLTALIQPQEIEVKGKALAERMRGHVAVVYATSQYLCVAYNWKIKMNETGKVPAFYNLFPEMNHNEINGFDVKEVSKSLSERMYFILFRATDDHPRNLKRMEVLQKIYASRGLKLEIVELDASKKIQSIFEAFLLADWTAYYTAEGYGLESEQVPVVEEFKKLITE